MGGQELDFVHEAFETNWLSPIGPNVNAFEAEVARYVGVDHAAALSSGTAAIHLALRILGIGPGDDVVVPTLTFCATANPVLYEGATPLFVDVEPATWTLDVDLLAELLASRARAGRLPAAVISVDLYGQCCDYERLEPLCAEYGIPLISDAAEALGATAHGRKAGSFGRCAVFSFNGNKIITTTGGGMLVSNDEALVTQARFLATQARDPAPHYQHSQLGFNYRLSNVSAGIGRGQLRVLDERVNQRRAIFERYQAALGDLPGVAFMPEAAHGRSTRWLTCLLLDPEATRVTGQAIREALDAQNIEARPVWKPLHLQPVFADCEFAGSGVANTLFERGLCLPSGSSLTREQQDTVILAVRRTFGASEPA